MREYYSVPFRMAFVEGGAKSFMAAYNAWNGIPMAVNPVIRDVVKKEWNAGWIITPDAGAMAHVVNLHYYYKTPLESMTAALKVGVGTFGGSFGRGGGPTTAELVKQAISEKLVTEADIDAAIVGKYKDVHQPRLVRPALHGAVHPDRYFLANRNPGWSEKHKTIARDVALESVVLLKNADNVLPLNRATLKSIAVVGPRAAKVAFDFYSGPTPYAISVLKGIQDKAGSAITVNKAANNIEDAIRAAKSSDVAVVVVGNDPMCGATSPAGAFNPDSSTKPCGDPGEGREGRDREKLDLPPAQEDLIHKVRAVNPKTVVVLIASFPFAINWEQQNVPAILHSLTPRRSRGLQSPTCFSAITTPRAASYKRGPNRSISCPT